MTQEEKQLLLKDLCARLPYGVKFGIGSAKLGQYDLTNIDVKKEKVKYGNGLYADLERCKPYLRPMSSTTDEEEILFRCELPAIAKTDAQLVAMRMELFLKGHLDFNHLIEKGLALEAPEGMYKF